MKHLTKSDILLVILLFSLAAFTKGQNPYLSYRLHSLPSGNGNLVNNRFKSKIVSTKNGEVWVLFNGQTLSGKYIESTNGAAVFSKNTWTHYTIGSMQLKSNYVTDIIKDKDVFMISTYAGLSSFNGTTWITYTTSNSGLINDSINDLLMTGNIVWIATNKGVSYKMGDQFYSLTVADGLIHNKVNCIEYGLNPNELLFGTDKGISLYNIKTKAWKNYNSSNSGLYSNKVNTLRNDAMGNIWIGSDSIIRNPDTLLYSVYRYRNDSIVNLDYLIKKECSFTGYAPFNCYAIAVAKGYVYFIANNTKKPDMTTRLVKYDPTENTCKLLKYNFTNRMKNMLIDADENGHLWMVDKDGSDYDSLYVFQPEFDTPEPKGNALVTYSLLNINKVSTPIMSAGEVGNDLDMARYEVPKGSCRKSIYSHSVWIGGITNNTLRLAAQTYRQNGTDFWNGPLSIGSAKSNETYNEKFNKVWNLNRYYIEEFKRNYAAGNVNNGSYTIPNDILNWPAMGDTTLGLDKYLAPFVDVNGDGMYDPKKGDYPKIRGDQMLYNIYNDNSNLHGETGGLPLGIEIQRSAYAYACDQFSSSSSNDVINLTTFYHLKFINRTNSQIDSFTIGLWTDYDIGKYSDDYIGCNPKEGYAFAYNGDDFDEGNLNGYGNNPPAIGLVVLKGLTDSLNTEVVGMTGHQYYENDNSSQGNPYKVTDYWNYLNHKWKDGTPVTYGGKGKGGIDTATYMYPMNDDLAGRLDWSEASASNTPGDRRSIVIVGPITLPAGGSTTLEYALVFSRATSGGAAASVSKLKTDITHIKSLYKSNNFPTCFSTTINGLKDEWYSGKSGYIYPNPVTNQFRVQLSIAQENELLQYTIYDYTGKLILKGNCLPNQSINIDWLDKGAYLVHVNGTMSSQIFKMIKD